MHHDSDFYRLLKIAEKGIAMEPKEKSIVAQSQNKNVVINPAFTIERHFLRYPFFDLDKKSNRDVLEIRETIHNENGERAEISWVVSRDVRSDFPSVLARKIFWKVIVPIINSLSRPIPRLIRLGSLRSIGDIIGEHTTTKIKKALKDIKKASIESKGTFFLKAKKIWLDDTFNLFDRVFFSGEELPDGTIADCVVIELSSYLHTNINAGYNVPLDQEFYNGLTGEITSRMYELLSLDFFVALEKGRSHVDKVYSSWCPYFPIVPQNKLFKVNKQFKAAFRQLTESKYFKALPEITPIFGSSLDWTIRFSIGEKAITEYARAKQKKLISKQDIPVNRTPLIQEQGKQQEILPTSSESSSKKIIDLTSEQQEIADWLKAQGEKAYKKYALECVHPIETIRLLMVDIARRDERVKRGERGYDKSKGAYINWALHNTGYNPPENLKPIFQQQGTQQSDIRRQAEIEQRKQEQLKEAYHKYREQKIEQYRLTHLDEWQHLLDHAYQEVINSSSFYKEKLDKDPNFKNSFFIKAGSEGKARTDIAEKLNLPSFETWLQQQTTSPS